MVVVDTNLQAPSQQEARMYHSSKVYKSGRNDALLWSKIFVMKHANSRRFLPRGLKTVSGDTVDRPR